MGGPDNNSPSPHNKQNLNKYNKIRSPSSFSLPSFLFPPQNPQKTMLSLTPPTIPKLPKPHPRYRLLKPLSSSSGRQRSNLPSPPPPPTPGANLYQPFRPPPSPLPTKYRSLDPGQRLDILRNRLGLWHEYAPLLSSLSHDGFTPPSIEEITGISGVDQNRLAVASRVRDSLAVSAPDLLPAFDASSAADLLYELRLVTSTQRESAARYAVERGFDGKAAQELARAIKDFPRRRGDHGWESFAADSPADCLAYTYFRLSREAIDTPDKLAWLQKASEIAETDAAKAKIVGETEKVTGEREDTTEDEEIASKASMPVVRLRYGEVAEASTVVLLPAIEAAEGSAGVKEAPRFCRWEGEVGVAAAEKGWARWMVLPGWSPVMGLGGEGGVAVEFASSRVLPWRVSKREEGEGVVVVVDRKRGAIEGDGDGFYLVSDGEVLGVERGSKVRGGEVEVLGAVALVVRPPKDEDDMLSEDEWD